MSTDEASIVTATGIENDTNHRNSDNDDRSVTVDGKQQEEHVEAAEITTTAEGVETPDADEIETNGNGTVTTEPIKSEESNEIQETAESTAETNALGITADDNERDNNFDTNENDTYKVSNRQPTSFEKSISDDLRDIYFVLFDLNYAT